VELGQPVHKLPAHVGTIEEVEPPDEGFDVVTAWELMEHVFKPRGFLGVILRILRPGGILAGSVPNYGRPVYRSGGDLGPLSCPPIHVNFWNRNALEHVLKHAGFVNTEFFWPRLTLDLIRPLRRPSYIKLIRFMKTILSLDVVTSMFFMCEKATKKPQVSIANNVNS